MIPRLVWHPSVFDAMKAVADKFGGVGAANMFADVTAASAPVCAYGIAHRAGVLVTPRGKSATDALYDLSNNMALGIDCTESDQAVHQIRGVSTRIPFEKWANEIGIVRGEIELPADVYDTLELSALAFDGIGYGFFYTGMTPCCILGHAGLAESDAPWPNDNGLFTQALAQAFGTSWWNVGFERNDPAVERINARKGTSPRAHVTFEEWCAELKVYRGA